LAILGYFEARNRMKPPNDRDKLQVVLCGIAIFLSLMSVSQNYKGWTGLRNLTARSLPLSERLKR
jgi:hypothetical protein